MRPLPAMPHTVTTGNTAYARIGDKLQSARLIAGATIKQAAEDIHIPTSYLQALEAGDWSALPGTVYARGYIKTYAEYLQADATQLLGLLEPTPLTHQPIRTPTLHHNHGSLKPRGLLLWCAIIGIAVIGGVMLAQTTVQHAPSPVRPIDAALTLYLDDVAPFYHYSCLSDTARLWPCFFTHYLHDPLLQDGA